MLTRDSLIWWLGIATSIIVGVSTNLHLFPWISGSAQHWINLSAFVLGIVSGKMATSPLPHSEDVKAEQVRQNLLADPPKPNGDVAPPRTRTRSISERDFD